MLNCSLISLLSLLSRGRLVEIDARGLFKVKGCEVGYETLAALAKDIKNAEQLRAELEGHDLLSLIMTEDKKAYPLRPFLLQDVPLTRAADGTYSILEKSGLKTIDEVFQVYKDSGQRMKYEKARLLRLPSFVPGATFEQAKSLLAQKPVGTFLVRQHGPNDMRSVYVDASEIREAHIEIGDYGWKVLPKDDRYGAGLVSYDVAELVKSQCNTDGVGYRCPLSDQPAYHGQVSPQELEKLGKGQYLLRMSSEPNKGAVLSCRTDRLENTRIEFSEKGYRIEGGTTWHKTVEDLVKSRYKGEFKAVPNVKTDLLESIKSLPNQAAINKKLCQQMAELWVNGYPKYTPEELVELLTEQKGVRLPAADEIRIKAFEQLDPEKGPAFIEKLSRSDLSHLLGLEGVKAKFHDMGVMSLRKLIEPDSPLYASHESLNSALKQAVDLLSRSNGLTKEEKAELGSKLVDALSTRRPEMWLKTDRDFMLDREFKDHCSKLWSFLDLGDFTMTFGP